MKLQLILGGQEVELNQNISIPLNKTYENLSNPMDIVVDYSKSINIPMTSINNNILANSYRLDRTIPRGGETNLGLYLDPTKKIPMKLLYNSSVVLEGYAKFVSSNKSTKNSYYTLNLFGVIGDIFQKLKNIVLTEDELTDEQKAEEDGGKKYVLHDRCDAYNQFLNAEYVKESWENSWNNVYGYYYDSETGFTGGSISPRDVIGFAPSYRGYYNEFESNKIQIYDGTDVDPEETIMGVDKYLEDQWKQTYLNSHPDASIETAENYVGALGASDVVGDGIKDYQMREYRAYYMKPYIYFNQLLQMYQDQLTQLSDYKLELDTNWFNINNPYWTRMCYMLDFIDSKDSNKDATEQITDEEPLAVTSYGTTAKSAYINASSYSSITNDYLTSNKSFVIDGFNLHLSYGYIGPKEALFWNNRELVVYKSTYFKVTITVKNVYSSETYNKVFYISYQPYNTAKQYINESDLSESNFIQMSKPDLELTAVGWEDYQNTGDINDVDIIYRNAINIPIPEFAVSFSNDCIRGVTITRSCMMKNNTTDTLFTNRVYLPTGITSSVVVSPRNVSQYFTASVGEFYIQRKWRDYIPINLRSIYFKEDAPLFDVILQYTKMFGLLWVPDYENKTIKIMHKSTYFNNIEIYDWSDKLDRTKDFIVEPITFGTRYIAFNYEDVDGHRYSDYKDKYGVNYGNKTISTGYDFGYETKDLFEGVSPSSASSKSFISYFQWAGWDLANKITPQTTSNAFIDCEDEEESSAISIYNWYLRGPNVTTDESIFITNDSPIMKTLDEFCWMHPAIAYNNGFHMTSMPTFNIAFSYPEVFPALAGRVLGGVFNTPNEDYTSSKLPSKSIGNSIYDLFWKKYLNERYNIQNKRVTAYFNIEPAIYIPFTHNKFIVIDNQLFMVNKIFDYDLSSAGLTKVELIQVTDQAVYRDGAEKFPYVVISPNNVDVIGSKMGDVDGSAVLTAHITLFDDSGEMTRGTWGDLEGRLTVYRGTLVSEEDVETDQNLATYNYVFAEYGDWESNIGRDSMYIYWYDMDGNKFEGSITYTVGDDVFEIPIVIDYTI